jgi:hypothetical protein
LTLFVQQHARCTANPCEPPPEAGTTMLHVTHAGTKLRKQTKPGQLTVPAYKAGAGTPSTGAPSCPLTARKLNTCQGPTSLRNGSTLQRQKMVYQRSTCARFQHEISAQQYTKRLKQRKAVRWGEAYRVWHAQRGQTITQRRWECAVMMVMWHASWWPLNKATPQRAYKGATAGCMQRQNTLQSSD